MKNQESKKAAILAQMQTTEGYNVQSATSFSLTRSNAVENPVNIEITHITESGKQAYVHVKRQTATGVGYIPQERVSMVHINELIEKEIQG